jgi:hypothetical protein
MSLRLDAIDEGIVVERGTNRLPKPRRRANNRKRPIKEITPEQLHKDRLADLEVQQAMLNDTEIIQLSLIYIPKGLY